MIRTSYSLSLSLLYHSHTQGLLERCKLAQEKLDDLRSILRETQAIDPAAVPLSRSGDGRHST